MYEISSWHFQLHSKSTYTLHSSKFIFIYVCHQFLQYYSSNSEYWSYKSNSEWEEIICLTLLWSQSLYLGTSLGKEGIPDWSTDPYPFTIMEKINRHARGPVHYLPSSIPLHVFWDSQPISQKCSKMYLKFCRKVE